jgi:hypothetical protein
MITPKSSIISINKGLARIAFQHWGSSNIISTSNIKKSKIEYDGSETLPNESIKTTKILALHGNCIISKIF